MAKILLGPICLKRREKITGRNATVAIMESVIRSVKTINHLHKDGVITNILAEETVQSEQPA